MRSHEYGAYQRPKQNRQCTPEQVEPHADRQYTCRHRGDVGIGAKPDEEQGTRLTMTLGFRDEVDASFLYFHVTLQSAVSSEMAFEARNRLHERFWLEGEMVGFCRK
ncbi:hypothetical protein D3C80_1347340 [compost metagenome]